MRLAVRSFERPAPLPRNPILPVILVSILRNSSLPMIIWKDGKFMKFQLDRRSGYSRPANCRTILM